MKKSLVLMVLGGMALANPAFAHAQLEKADPPAGSMPTAPVAHIDLYYTEELEPAFSKATLVDETGKPVEASSVVDAKDAKHLALTPKTPLQDGTFKVEWRVVSVDTHKTQGSFDFMVMP